MSAQAAFMAALRAPNAALPEGLSHPIVGGDATPRFDIYRNNVVFSLMQNLRDGYPILHKLIGQPAFDEMAHAYVHAHPPTCPLMFAYGETLPHFIDAFAPLRAVLWASDVARLDLAMRHVAQAADHIAPPPDSLALTDPQAQGMRLASGLVALACDAPIFDLWTHLEGRASLPPETAASQEVMVYRLPDYAIETALLPHGGAGFIAALQAGACLAQAAQSVDEAVLPHVLSKLLGAGLVLALFDTDRTNSEDEKER